ncbi:MAG TPA: transcriptional regulator [Leptospiraceae bacterium]|nr:transcriptional regulator [Spirochaetaceae bacterium]HBS06978.1 transcriptional regulator [Leptospiraceae bacterium]
MVEERNPALDEVFHALADGTRRSILETVLNGPSTVGDLAEPYEMSLAAVSKHVVVLEQAGLVSRTRQGRRIIVTARPEELKPAIDLLQYYSTFWKRSLDSLEEFLLGSVSEPAQSLDPTTRQPQSGAKKSRKRKESSLEDDPESWNQKDSRSSRESGGPLNAPAYSNHGKKKLKKNRRKGQ